MLIVEILLMIVVLLLLVYTARHYLFTLNRLFGRQRPLYFDVHCANWPTVTVIVPAHNEESVIAEALQSLLDVDYPTDKLVIVPVNDRSTDGTAQIIDEFAALYPGRIRPVHRHSGKPGKSAVLKQVSQTATSDILIVFDADYVPSKSLIRQLVAPFFDPEVGAVMGRVVPVNVGVNLLTRMLDLERAAGYQVDQAARMNLGLVPQYGGTVGGVRRRALEAIGGWNDSMLAEDTDVTFRLLVAGWKTVYQNRSECYEEVPEEWRVRTRQIARWANGHNQVLFANMHKVITSKGLRFRERLDGVLLLGIFMMPLVLVVGFFAAYAILLFGSTRFVSEWLVLLAVAACGTIGNSAAFFEIAAAAYLDRSRNRIRLLPLILLGFLVNLFVISKGSSGQITGFLRGVRPFDWQKTSRYRLNPAQQAGRVGPLRSGGASAAAGGSVTRSHDRVMDIQKRYRGN